MSCISRLCVYDSGAEKYDSALLRLKICVETSPLSTQRTASVLNSTLAVNIGEIKPPNSDAKEKIDILAEDHSVAICKCETTECICLIDDKHTFRIYYENDTSLIKRYIFN